MAYGHVNLEKTLFEQIKDAVIAVDAGRQILRLNQAAETMFGVTAATSLGKHIDTLFETAGSSDDLFQPETHLDPDIDIPFMPMRPARAPAFFGQVTMSPIFDDDEIFCGILFVIRDVTPVLQYVTRIKREADALRQSYSLATTTLETLPVCFAQIKADGLIQTLSNASCDFLGMDRANLVSQRLMDILDGDLKNLARRHILSRPDGNSVRIYEYKHHAPGGNIRWYVWSILDVFKNGKRNNTICIGNDVTDIHETQTSIAAQSVELQRKNEALGQFAAIVSHDLKAPLRHIAMFADMMNEDVTHQKYEDLSLYAHHVRNSAVRMDRIIKSLLQYSQISYRIVEKTRFDPSGLIINAIQNLESVIEEAKAEILVEKLPALYGDAELIRHLVQNLLSNAVKYRKPGNRPKIRIYALETAGSVQLIVEDNGIGIDPKHATRIFGPFQRLHKDEKIYEGFGIGLALCRQIAESHDGSIELDTHYVNGARFIVHLPTASEADER
ncbi:MAG: hypothetical protein RIR97_1016 [Pseudomonadota bacterium]